MSDSLEVFPTDKKTTSKAPPIPAIDQKVSDADTHNIASGIENSAVKNSTVSADTFPPEQSVSDNKEYTYISDDGILESEVESSTNLSGAFAELYARFSSTHTRFMSGALPIKDFGDSLQDLMVLTEDGVLWTIGATTTRWYKKDPRTSSTWEPSALPATQKGKLVDRNNNTTGWESEELTNIDTTTTRFSAYTGDSSLETAVDRVELELGKGHDPEEQEKDLEIDYMFGPYTDTGSIADSNSPEPEDDTILEVEDISEYDDTWKKVFSAE